MIRRPPRSTLDRSSAASDVYKRQALTGWAPAIPLPETIRRVADTLGRQAPISERVRAVSYTHLRAHETVLDLVCRLLLEKKKQHIQHTRTQLAMKRSQDNTQVQYTDSQYTVASTTDDIIVE